MAIVADDYVGLRPAMAVREGDQVRLGTDDPDRQDPSRDSLHRPGCGVVRAVNRGAKRKLLSIEIDLAGRRGRAVCDVWHSRR